MKYFMYAQVDNLTGVSVMKQQKINSPTHPQIPGLDIIWTRNNYWYATVDDTATADPDNFIFELTSDQWIAAIQSELATRKTDLINQINAFQKTLRDKMVQNYHVTELIAGAAKVPQAIAALAAATDADADTAAPLLQIEATARGITTKQLAQKIIDLNNTLTILDAHISGVAGGKTDAVNAVVFDANDPTSCIKEFSTMIDGSTSKIPKYNVNLGWPKV